MSYAGRHWDPAGRETEDQVLKDETDHMTTNASNTGNIISGLVITAQPLPLFPSMAPHSHHLRVFTLLQDVTVMEKMKTVHMTC